MYKESFYNIDFSEEKNCKIIYNSISKAYLKVPNDFDMYKLVVNMNENNHSYNKLDYILIDNGFVIDNEVDELAYLEMIYRKNFYDNATLNIIMIPSFACNFNCPYCFEAPSRNRYKKGEYFEVLKKFADKNFKMYQQINLSMFGGEPLLMFDENIEFFKYVEGLSDKNGFRYTTSITTNGTLITEDVLEKLMKYNCKTLQITLDGCRKTHDITRRFKDGKPSFDKLIKIINTTLDNYIGKNKIKFILRINMNNNTVGEIVETLNLIKKGIREKTYLVLRPIYNTKNYLQKNKNNFRQLKELYEISSEMGFNIMKNNYYYRSCEACGDEKFFYLTPDLKMWKCVNSLEVEKACIGRINKNGEIEVNDQNLVNWCKAADVFSDDKCKICKFLPDCFGGCILYNVSNGKRKCSPMELVSLPYLYE